MHKHITFQDILDTLRDKYGEGFYRFRIKDGRLVGANIYEDDRADQMDDIHSSVRIETIESVEIKKDLTEWGVEKNPPILKSGRIFVDKREMKPVFGHNPVEVLK